ncbi:hypothetical protein [Lacticaseibacillus yichunensis]|uniref:ABC-2 family transporter n=1 Tax=Lacticaseibacillus yichunensis TaxID=2486015 RepID=A0ABW4CN88_9LACO|nr:hypothetical protein [Lacticaseibacillus yichunensis]
MSHLFFRRIERRPVLLSFSLLMLISLIQYGQSSMQIAKRSSVFHDSPYTMWLSMDQFSFIPILFFLLVPLLAAIPGATLIAKDRQTRFTQQLILRRGGMRVAWGYLVTSFLLGAVLVGGTLLINFFGFFLLLPNLKPDFFLNLNIAVMSQDTLWVGLYYTHPLWHALASILLAATWSGLFASFATAMAWFLKNRFLTVAAGLLLQIGLMAANLLLPLPVHVSFVPSDFMRESAGATLSGAVVAGVTVIVVLVVAGLTMIGGRVRAYESNR